MLWLSNTDVTNECVERLANLKSLEFLAIDGTQISASGVALLRKKLPNLTIE